MKCSADRGRDINSLPSCEFTIDFNAKMTEDYFIINGLNTAYIIGFQIQVILN